MFILRIHSIDTGLRFMVATDVSRLYLYNAIINQNHVCRCVTQNGMINPN